MLLLVEGFAGGDSIRQAAFTAAGSPAWA